MACILGFTLPVGLATLSTAPPRGNCLNSLHSNNASPRLTTHCCVRGRFNVEVTGAARLYRAASVLTAGLALQLTHQTLKTGTVFCPRRQLADQKCQTLTCCCCLLEALRLGQAMHALTKHLI